VGPPPEQLNVDGTVADSRRRAGCAVEDSGQGGSHLRQAGRSSGAARPASRSGHQGRAGAPRLGRPRWAGNRAREERRGGEQRWAGGR
jgi:hypothetical protein